MGQLAIIADDLSSCTDCGVQIARYGYQTLVLLDQDYSRIEKFDVIAVDTDSRALSAEDAYQLVIKAAGLVQGHFDFIYKSLDSTLRGNLGAEIDAVMDIIDFDLAIIAPAFPFYGRTTRRGIHYLRGRRINETEFASDPQNPVKEADLTKLFSSQSRRSVGLVELSVLHRGNAAVAGLLRDLRSKQVELVIFDIQLETDLEKVVSTVSASGYRVLWVGSTGLAGHIASILRVGPRQSFEVELTKNSKNHTMVVAGSASEVTRAQLDNLRRSPEVSAVTMDPYKIIQGELSRQREIDRCRTEVMRELRKGRDLILQVASTREDIAAVQAIGLALGQSSAQISTHIAASLAETTARLVENFPVYGLVVTGGDTAKWVCRYLGAQGIHILGEVEPGIPLARLIGKNSLYLITKAGGFGNSETLIHANNLLKGRRE